MREILFRGKQETNNEWIEGGIVPSLNGKEFYIGNMFEANKVIPETVGQYTGLNDKNGKKIFEGDIVTAYFNSNRSYQKFRVIFKNGAFLFDNGSVEVPVWDIYCLRIIGNIHDNPELLGGDH